MVKISHDRLSHMIFLSEVVLTGNKKESVDGGYLTYAAVFGEIDQRN